MYKTALASIMLTATAFFIPQGSAAAQTPVESIMENIKGHWEANDATKKGRLVKFYTMNRIPSFEDEVEPGTVLTGTVQQDDTGADIMLQYVTGFQCRYKMTFKAGHSDGDEMTFRLVSEDNPSHNKRFKCFEGRLERIQRRAN